MKKKINWKNPTDEDLELIQEKGDAIIRKIVIITIWVCAVMIAIALVVKALRRLHIIKF